MIAKQNAERLMYWFDNIFFITDANMHIETAWNSHDDDIKTFLFNLKHI